MIKRSLTLLLFFSCAFQQAIAQVSASQASADDLVFMRDEEPAMRRAFQKAKSTLDDFLKIYQSGNPDYDAFAVKVGISDSGETEYFWISDFTWSNEKFTGKIDNEPQLVKSVKADQLYSFKKAQIVDWLYLDRPRKKMVGNFTYCALLSKEPPKQAEAARRRFNLDCET